MVVPKQFRFMIFFRIWIFNTSRSVSEACKLCYATSPTNYDVAYDVTCLALWHWINLFLSVCPDDYRSCRLIQLFCHKYSFVFLYIIVIRLEAWLTNLSTVNLLKSIKEKENLLFLVNTKYIIIRTTLLYLIRYKNVYIHSFIHINLRVQLNLKQFS